MKFEPPFGESVVSRRGLMTTGTNGFRTHAGIYGDFDALTVGTEAGLPVNKSGETMASIQNCDELQHEVEDGTSANF